MKRALVVGIDDYPGSPLQGCVADAVAVAELLAHHEDGAPNFDIRLVTDPASLGRGSLRTLLAELFENAGEAELVLFFAGHGAQTSWGAELVTPDFEQNSMGVSMDDIITLANGSAARDVVVILDCCYSGDIGNVPALQAAAVAPEHRLGTALLAEGVTLLAASRATETSAESGGHGAFTRVLLEGLEGAAADVLGDVTSLSLYAFASRAFGAWDQRPVFKSHVTRPSVLRRCPPWIDPVLLRRLPEFFATPETSIQMHPGYEGEGRPLPTTESGTLEQQAFDYFKQLRNAGLLGTEDEMDLFFVAMESRRVHLTSAGRYFWRLAKDDRL